MVEGGRPQECTAGSKERVSGSCCNRKSRQMIWDLSALPFSCRQLGFSSFSVPCTLFLQSWECWPFIKQQKDEEPCLWHGYEIKKSAQMEQWAGEQVSLLPKLLVPDLLVGPI